MRRWVLGTAAFAAAMAALVGFLRHPWTTTAVIAAAVLLSLRPAARTVRHRWTYIWPTESAIRTITGAERVRLRIYGQVKPRPSPAPSRAEAKLRAAYSRVEPALRWLPDRAQRMLWAALRPVGRRLDWFRRPDPVRMRLTVAAAHLSADQRINIAAIVHDKLPLGELSSSWRFIGRRSTCTWRTRSRPPTHVGLAELNAAFPKLADWEFFLGHDDHGKPLTISLEDDSPHVCCSAGSGGGKSVLARLRRALEAMQRALLDGR